MVWCNICWNPCLDEIEALEELFYVLRHGWEEEAKLYPNNTVTFDLFLKNLTRDIQYELERWT